MRSYQRDVYPVGMFQHSRVYDSLNFESRHSAVSDYISHAVLGVREVLKTVRTSQSYDLLVRVAFHILSVILTQPKLLLECKQSYVEEEESQNMGTHNTLHV